MSIVRADDNLYPFALSYFFSEDRGFPIVLEMFDGTVPTKTELEAADIFEDSNTGWIDNTKLETFLASYNIIRRWKLNDFSKDIEPIDAQTLAFKFAERPNSDFLVENDSFNQINEGTVTWYLVRSIDTSNSVTHYAFVGTISDLNSGGDMEISRRALTTADFIKPSSIIIDLGSLTVT